MSLLFEGKGYRDCIHLRHRRRGQRPGQGRDGGLHRPAAQEPGCSVSRSRSSTPTSTSIPGTMSPYQHGEVFVTDDGAETDLDLGHYERFVDENLGQANNVTTGQIYSQVLGQGAPRRLPGRHDPGHPARHQRDQATASMDAARHSNADVVIVEVGGTVGDIEGAAVPRGDPPDAQGRGPEPHASTST